MDNHILHLIIADMWSTMYAAEGCGLAAPQIGIALRIFVIDSRQAFADMQDESRQVYFDDNKGIHEVFINPVITILSERTWKREEACLSIPGVQGDVTRPWSIRVDSVDEHFQPKTMTVSGLTARMILHEFDHINGVLFIDHLKPFTRRLIKRRLKRIAAGKQSTNYKMVFPEKS